MGKYPNAIKMVFVRTCWFLAHNFYELNDLLSIYSKTKWSIVRAISWIVIIIHACAKLKLVLQHTFCLLFHALMSALYGFPFEWNAQCYSVFVLYLFAQRDLMWGVPMCVRMTISNISRKLCDFFFRSDLIRLPSFCSVVVLFVSNICTLQFWKRNFVSFKEISISFCSVLFLFWFIVYIRRWSYFISNASQVEKPEMFLRCFASHF